MSVPEGWSIRRLALLHPLDRPPAPHVDLGIGRATAATIRESILNGLVCRLLTAEKQPGLISDHAIELGTRQSGRRLELTLESLQLTEHERAHDVADCAAK